jgi:LmbE family N-acetylglucosaminyl deacetylase
MFSLCSPTVRPIPVSFRRQIQVQPFERVALMRIVSRVSLLLLITTITGAALAADARPPRTMNAAEMQLAIRKLGVVGTALYVAAHPDDENTAMLAQWANGALLRTGYLSLTRGDGGQNLIGDEKGDLLGVIRTEELLAARSIDGAEQFFTRGVDFGYSKSPDETLGLWDREAILSDVVWVVRSFRPDIIVTRFPTTGEGGHGQHTASGLLAVEAFEAAADPKRFPDQLKQVEVWKPKRIFWNLFRRSAEAPIPPESISVELGGYNALLGQSYGELAGSSRSMHRSQGFGAPERRGALPNYLLQLGGDRAATDPLEGIDLSWGRVAGGAGVGAAVAAIERDFDPAHPAKSIPALLALRKQIAALDDPIVAPKLREIDALVQSASGLWLEAVTPAAEAVAGEKIVARTTALVRSDVPVTVRSITFRDLSGAPIATSVKSGSADPLKPNTVAAGEFELTVPSVEPTQPHWLDGATTEERPRIMAGIDDQKLRSQASAPAAVIAEFGIDVAGTPLTIARPLAYRWLDRVEGELYRTFNVAPAVTVSAPETVLFSTAAKRQVELTLQKRGTATWKGTIAPLLPAGWKSEPASIPVELNGESRKKVAFTIEPPKTMSSAPVRFELSAAGSKPVHARSSAEINYEHIPRQQLFPILVSRLVRADVAIRGQEIGYVAGSGDDLPGALEQMGYRVSMVTDAELEEGRLSKFDAIVLGIRALNSREAAKRNFDHLLGYVEEGGTLVVQYNTSDETLAKQIAPFPLAISRDRVTLENAPVTIANPDHPLMRTPNRIGAADFEGWVQERGLYFPGTIDERYTTALSMNDPGEKPLTSGVIAAQHGKGMYIYTPLSLFRQIPAGVPGAYRLLANLVSAKGSAQ